MFNMILTGALLFISQSDHFAFFIFHKLFSKSRDYYNDKTEADEEPLAVDNVDVELLNR